MELKVKLAGSLYKFHKLELKYFVLTLYRIFLIVNVLIGPSIAAHFWENPGCHRVGHTREVRIPGCLGFNVTTNACRGYCTSYAIPSPAKTIRANPRYKITSRAECCSIDETHDVEYLVRCLGGTKEVTFKSAETCSCSFCRRG